eukprot:SRR837773.5089.p3 GENE.SRR837773.5089~~SRR837773.5089.p3  ORF type:complete len:314 (+),score=125.60 SRR837773.5089:3-944(+)
MSSVGVTEYGLKYNRFSKTVDSGHVYRGGRHLIGMWGAFLTFPATRQNIEFSNRKHATAPPLDTRTKEGLSLKLHVVFQYQIRQKEVPELYQLASTTYEKLYTRVARDVLLKAAARYNAPEYWRSRDKIGAEMHKLVDAALAESHADCTGLQIMIIDLPDTYEQSIVSTQVQKQQIKTRENEQRATFIRAQIGVMVAEYNRNITVTLAAANADAERVRKSADAEAQQMRIDAEKGALTDIQSQFGLTPAGLVQYQRALAYQQMPASTFLYGVENPVVVLSGDAPSPAAPAGCAAAAATGAPSARELLLAPATA